MSYRQLLKTPDPASQQGRDKAAYKDMPTDHSGYIQTNTHGPHSHMCTGLPRGHPLKEYVTDLASLVNCRSCRNLKQAQFGLIFYMDPEVGSLLQLKPAGGW